MFEVMRAVGTAGFFHCLKTPTARPWSERRRAASRLAADVISYGIEGKLGVLRCEKRLGKWLGGNMFSQSLWLSSLGSGQLPSPYFSCSGCLLWTAVAIWKCWFVSWFIAYIITQTADYAPLPTPSPELFSKQNSYCFYIPLLLKHYTYFLNQ